MYSSRNWPDLLTKFTRKWLVLTGRPSIIHTPFITLFKTVCSGYKRLMKFCKNVNGNDLQNQKHTRLQRFSYLQNKANNFVHFTARVL